MNGGVKNLETKQTLLFIGTYWGKHLPLGLLIYQLVKYNGKPM
jgi:hypothetical protein